MYDDEPMSIWGKLASVFIFVFIVCCVILVCTNYCTYKNLKLDHVNSNITIKEKENLSIVEGKLGSQNFSNSSLHGNSGILGTGYIIGHMQSGEQIYAYCWATGEDGYTTFQALPIEKVKLNLQETETPTLTVMETWDKFNVINRAKYVWLLRWRDCKTTLNRKVDTWYVITASSDVISYDVNFGLGNLP